METGTRGLLGAALGSGTDRDEAGIAWQLLPLPGPGMLVLLDRAFDATGFLTEVAGTGASLLVRAKSTRTPPVLQLPDGSYRSDLDGLPVRIIEADLLVTGAVYQLLRIVMGEAIESSPDLDPDRASFAISLHAARDQVTAAAGIVFDDQQDPLDLLGVIGRAVLAGTLPERRARYSRPCSPAPCPSGAPGTAPARSTTPPPLPGTRHHPPAAHHHDRDHRGHPSPSPGDRPAKEAFPNPTTSRPDPPRAGHDDHGHRPGPRLARQRPRSSARHQDPKSAHQLGEWTRLGYLSRTGTGTYAPPDTPPRGRP